MKLKTQKTIATKPCFIYNAGSKDILLIQPIGEHDLETMDEEVGLIGKLTGGQPFTMVMFMTDWNRDLPPWEADAVMGDEDFEAGAADTLRFITEKLVPEMAEGSDPRVLLGGYSLAGLFALWAGYQTGRFAGVAAASPSVWYPGWPAFAEENAVLAPAVYLSLGTKEEKARNPVLKTVGENIRRQHEILSQDPGCRVILEMNPGNHFREPELRMAKGFAWLMQDETDR